MNIALAENDSAPARLKRADSFLGIHFDFHAEATDKDIGKNTTPRMIENIIDQVHPDYIQIDCKGHPGFSSYPTKVGNPAPGVVGDPLKIWREVTASRGVALYMHYSGIYDRSAAAKPGWAVINADGKPNEKSTSFWGPYAEELLIPQLRELAGVYGVDGAWIDGECWACVPDYGPAAIEAFQRETGIKTIPRKPGDPYWFEFLQFHREAFRRYLRNYVTAIHRTYPDFQICSNWAFTDYMPEPVSAPVSFLSGDYMPEDAVNSARLASRLLAHQGKAWDLMAWSFSSGADHGPKIQKPAVQLEREAAVVLAQGGGFQAYFTQKRDGSIREEQMPVMAEVAKFCRARQAIAHHSRSIPQIAILLSTDDQYRRNNELFGRDLFRVKGVLQALLKSQQSVDVLSEHQLTGRLSDYPLIIVPECDYLAAKFRDELVKYARKGGTLLVIGPSAARLFEEELGVKLSGDVHPPAPLQLAFSKGTLDLTSAWQDATLSDGTRAVGELLVAPAPDATPLSRPAASVAKLGQGKIGAIYFQASRAYLKKRPALLGDFLDAVVRKLFPTPMVTVKGSRDVEVVAARNHGKLLVHLINTSGPHETEPILKSIAPVGPLEVTIRSGARPSRVTLEPGGREQQFVYGDGIIHLTIPKLDIYDILAVESR